MKNKKINKTSLITVLLAVLGVCLLVVGGIGGARAALTESDDYTAEMTTLTIQAQLKENGTAVCDSSSEEVGTLLADVTSLEVGKPYNEALTVVNTGKADAFVRITLYKYWTAIDPESEEEVKRVDLDPEYINLFFGSDWKVDKSASTKERTVLYYTKALTPGTESSNALTKIAPSSDLSTLVKQEVVTNEETGRTVITSTYQYDGLTLNLEASVDAIQVHNANDAIKAAWGVNVTADESAGTLTVK